MGSLESGEAVEEIKKHYANTASYVSARKGAGGQRARKRPGCSVTDASSAPQLRGMLGTKRSNCRPKSDFDVLVPAPLPLVPLVWLSSLSLRLVGALIFRGYTPRVL